MANSDESLIKAVGEELRAIRDERGMTRPQLIDRLERPMPVNTYACYEQGIRPVPVPQLARICRALEVPLPELMERALRRAGWKQAAMSVYVTVAQGEVASTLEVSNTVMMDLASDGSLLGIEIIGGIDVRINGRPVR